MASVAIRYLRIRARKDGVAYYWIPSKALRNAGFAIRRLDDDRAIAITQAEQLNATLDAYYAGKPIEPAGPAPGTLAWADQQFQNGLDFSRLQERTRRDYSYNIRPALEWAGDIHVAKISRPAIMHWRETLYGPRDRGGLGEGNARNALVAFRRLMTHAYDQGWTKQHLALKLNLPAPAKREGTWTDDQVAKFGEAARQAGRRSMDVAVLLGWCLGQRPYDTRMLPWTAYGGSAFMIRQAKGGKLIKVPALPELRAALAETPRVSTQIVVNEATERPYTESAFQHVFAEIRAKAGLPRDLQFRDLRHTVATALGRAGCNVHQIQAVTGQETIEILQTYVHPDDSFAAAAIAKLGRSRRRAKRERS
jgi:integrase